MPTDRRFSLIFLPIALCGLLFWAEFFLDLTYLWQIWLKWCIFFIIPWWVSWRHGGISDALGTMNRKGLMYGSLYGLSAAALVVLAYYLLGRYVDWEIVRGYLTDRGITSTTFMIAFAYVTFGNSFLEEVFFRGWVFRRIAQYHKMWAYILSSLLFSLYHLTIFSDWFGGVIVSCILWGLFLSGIFFAFLYTQTQSIWSAWIVHIFADSAIVVIGYLLFFS